MLSRWLRELQDQKDSVEESELSAGGQGMTLCDASDGLAHAFLAAA